jgi:hypothetical protein
MKNAVPIFRPVKKRRAPKPATIPTTIAIRRIRFVGVRPEGKENVMYFVVFLSFARFYFIFIIYFPGKLIIKGFFIWGLLPGIFRRYYCPFRVIEDSFERVQITNRGGFSGIATP